MWSVFVVVTAIDAEYVLELAAAEDEDPVEAVGAGGVDAELGEGVCIWRLDRGADHFDALGREISSNAWLNLVSRSWMRNRNGCSSSNCMTRLRACWVSQRPSGFELQARYSILRVASEMKKRT